MNYAKTKNNVVVEYPYGFNQLQADNPYTLYPNTDVAYWFPLTDSATEGYVLVDVLPTPQPAYDWITQGIKEGNPELTNNQWFQTWEVYQLTPEEVSANEITAKSDNKAQATTLLQQTDWTAPASIADPVESNPYLANRAAFLNYRSQVRDIALDPPVVVQQWPVMPEEQWATS